MRIRNKNSVLCALPSAAVITEIISILVLHEVLTRMSALGMALSLAGLFISEDIGRKNNANTREKMCDDD